MRLLSRMSLTTGLLACLLGHPAVAENWPQFRGAAGQGVSTVEAPIRWDVTTGTNIAWQIPLPGLGHAGPVVWEDHVVIATAVRPGARPGLKIGVYGDGDSFAEKELHQWRLLCLDRKTGRTRWDVLGHEAIPRQERHTKASHCNSTPATDGRHIVTLFGSEGLFCFRMDGSPVWRKDLGKMDAGPWDSPDLQWSFASSPLLQDGKVVVQCDVLSEQFVAVFDSRDGRELWRTRRSEVGNWCTPALARVNGRAQIVLNGWKEIGGYDFESGQRIWTLSGGGDIPVPAPLVVGDMAYFTTAHGKFRPLRAVRLNLASGDISPAEVGATNAAVPWCHPRLGSYMQTPIALGDLLWSCDWQGVLTCVDRFSGKIHYSERLGKGGQAFTASGVAAGRHLYFISENGEAFVVDASPTFAVAAANSVGAPCLATPAVVDGTLFVRTSERLIAIRHR